VQWMQLAQVNQVKPANPSLLNQGNVCTYEAIYRTLLISWQLWMYKQFQAFDLL
jgi:hypothetical protein